MKRSNRKPRFRTSMLAAVSTVLTLGSTSSAAPYQENPFKTATGSAAASTTPSPSPDSDPNTFKLTLENRRSDVALVVRSIRQQDPQTPAELTDAISTLINIEAWGDAQAYLKQLNQVAMDDSALYELYKLRGAEFFYVLHSIEPLAPESKQIAKRVLSAARNYSESNTRIDRLVTTLADKDINVRSKAFRQIKLIGPKAYAAMLEVFADESKSDLWPGVRGAVRRLNEDATQILIAGATSGNRQIEVESYFGLANLDSRDAIELISYLYLSPETPANVRSFAETKLLRHYGGTIDRGLITSQLAERANAELRGPKRIVRSEAKISLWQYDEATKKFQYNRVPLAVASRIRAASMAGMLFAIDPTNSQNRTLFLLATIESAKKQAGPDALIDVESLMKKLGSPNANELNRLLGEAIDRDLITSAIGICELLKETGDASLLGSSNGYSPLVESVLTGERHLQFAALDAIIKLDPKTAYPGSSYVMDLAAYLARTSGKTKVLVGHYASPDTRTFEGIVANTGTGVESVRNGLNFYNQAIESPDWKLLLLTDNLLRPKFGQVIQMLRADWRTRYLPIGIVISDESNRVAAERLAQSDRLIRVIDLNFETSIVNSQIALFDGLAASWEVSDSSRVLHASVAAKWIGAIASDSMAYRFYNVRKHEDSIYSLFYIPGQARLAKNIAVQLGTPRAQRELINFASHNGQKLDGRVAAAEAFASSVEKFGVLLTSDEIRQQYQRYNSSVTEDKEVQAVFASMLDAIESKRNSRLAEDAARPAEMLPR